MSFAGLRIPVSASGLRVCVALLVIAALSFTSCRVESSVVDVNESASVDNTTAEEPEPVDNLARLPTLGPIPGASHWHAAYVVRVCDDVLTPFDSDADPLGIHSHADGVMHIHPFFEESGYEAATIGLFADAMGLSIAEGTLTLPNGETWSDGDMCGDRPGRVFVDRWEDPRTESTAERIFEDPAGIRFLADGEWYQIAFAPSDARPVVPPSAPLLDELSNLDRPAYEPWIDPDPRTMLRQVSVWPVASVTGPPCGAEQVAERVLMGDPACFTAAGESVAGVDAITNARAVIFNREPAVEVQMTAALREVIDAHFASSDMPMVLAFEIDGAVITAPTLASPPVSQERLVISGGLTTETAMQLAEILGS